MASYREFPRRGWALITRVIYLIAAATTTGSLVGFLLIVWANIVGAEVLGGLWSEANGDALMRTGIVVTSITAVISIGLVTYFLSLSRATYARQLGAAAVHDGELGIPPRRELAMLRSVNPFIPLYFFSLYFVIFDALALLILGLALGETFRYNEESAREGLNVFVSLAALGVIVVLIFLLAHFVGLRTWKRYTAIAMEVWAPRIATADSRLRAGIPTQAMSARLTPLRALVIRGSSITLAISSAAFLLGVYLRKPGRRAPTQYYDEPVERFIDFLVAASSVITMAALVVLLLALLVAFFSNTRQLLRLRGFADGTILPTEREGYRRKKRGKSLTAFQDLLAQSWPGQQVGSILVGIGWGTAPFFSVTGATVPVAWAEWTVPTLLILGALGTGVLLWSDGAAARSRNRLLEAWS